jgi:hypothetical protein
MFTIGFVRKNEVYATLRGWLHLSMAQNLCDHLNSGHPWTHGEVGEYDYTIIIEIGN